MRRQKADIHPVRRAVGWAIKLAAGLFVGAHIYALALIIAPVPGTATMAQRSVHGETLRREMTALEDISPYLVLAVIAAEDTKFCAHKGVDPEAVRKVIEERKGGKRLRGGSTITQQTAKNVFLWNGGGFARKGGEAWMATFIDFTWGKSRVMEVYLNVAEWGDGIFGAEAAAQARFGKSAADLTAREAALLASVLPSPNKWRLDPPGPYVAKRAGTIQARMGVVRRQGLAACVLDKDALPARPAPQRPQPNTPQLEPEMPELEPVPQIVAAPLDEEVPELADLAAPLEDSPLSDVIDAADEVFGVPAGDVPELVEGETPEADPDKVPKAEEAEPELPIEAEPSGPVDLIPPVKETAEEDVPNE